MWKINIEKIFITLGFIFGCLFIFIIPPFQSPDEDSHFKKAYVISQGQFYEESNKKITGLQIPNTMNEYISNKLSMMGNRDQKYSYSSMYYEQLLPNNLSDKSLTEVSTSATTPFAHLVPALGILFSKIISPIFVNGTPSVSYMLQFARFFSLISYLLLGYFAIKVTPAFKKSMCAILLLPMSVFLGSMVSYDNLLIPLTLLAIANILNLIYNKKENFDKRYFLIFTIIGYILLNVKMIYFPILALLIFVPKEKFKNKSRKEKIKKIIELSFAILVLTIIFKIPQFLLDTTSSSSTLSSDQLMFVLTNPFEYVKILASNIFYQFWGQMYWMVGTFGLIDTYLPPLFMIIAFLNLLFVFVMDGISEKIEIKLKQKFFIMLIIIIIIVGMYTAMYIVWTPKVFGIIGGSEITGVQGRYFIPVLICLPLLLANSIFKNNKKIVNLSKNYFTSSLIIYIMCLIISIFVSLTRFWI